MKEKCHRSFWSIIRTNDFSFDTCIRSVIRKGILCSGTSHFISSTCYRMFWPSGKSNNDYVLCDRENLRSATSSSWENLETRTPKKTGWSNVRYSRWSNVPLASSAIILECSTWNKQASSYDLIIEQFATRLPALDKLSGEKQNKKVRGLHW